MTIEIERDAFLAALRQVVDVVEARTTIPVLANLMLVAEAGRLSITGTNLDMEATVTVQAAGELDTTVPKDKLLAAVQSLKPGRLTLAMAEGRPAVTLKQGRAVRTLSVLSTRDFPKRKELEGGTTFRLPAKALTRLLDSCSVAQSTEETRYYLMGVFLHLAEGQLRAAATDGHRFIRAETAAPDDLASMPDVIIPTKAVALLRKQLSKSDAEVTVTFTEGAFRVQHGAAQLIGKLVEGTFPDYTRVIPSPGRYTLAVDRDGLLEAVNGVAAVISAEGDKIKVRAIALETANGSCTVSAQDTSGASASDELAGTFGGGDLRFGLNSTYAISVAGVFAEGASLDISLDSSSAALRITSDKDPDLLGVIMPMRV